jgi:hypothetical protein
VRPDERTLLASRDITIGVHSLVVGDDPQRQRDVVLINQGCEAFDTMVVGQEIRDGRPFEFVAFAAYFGMSSARVYQEVRVRTPAQLT